MVCAACETKLSKLVTTRGGGGTAAPRATFLPCRACKASVHLPGAAYCQGCSYRNGICAYCGTRVLNTAGYRMSSK